MIRVLGDRGSGKSTRLLKIAEKKGCTIVSFNHQSADFLRRMAKEMGLEKKVRIIDPYSFLIERISSRHDGKYLIDELDLFLSQINVVGYSNTAEFFEEDL